MELKIQIIDDVAVAELPVDHLDASNCEELEKPLLNLIDEHKDVILDINNVEFIDSSGVGVLLFCVRKCDSEGGRISICNPSDAVQMAFELVRINRICEILPSRQEALDSYKRRN